VYASADGVVTVAEDFGGGWGLVVRVVHRFEEEDGVDVVETVYAHLDEMYVEPGDYLLRGDLLGTIGDAHGVYVPHLHFELRTDPGMRLGGGYDRLGIGYTDPRAFVRQHGCRG
jgi:murein DD-endopeptidase MepM/ murein hydrolase activator NlpD